MVRGCTIAFVLWLVLAAGYWYWLDHTFDPPGSIIAGLLVGLVVAGCIGSIINARIAWRDWTLALGSKNGLPLVDRRIVAVSGTIHPLEKPLIAPFSGKECVLCEYDLGRAADTSKGQNSAGSDFAGFLMTPCVVRSHQGDVKLLGFPVLEGYPDLLCDGFTAASNGYQFLRGTEFEDRTGLKLVTILSVFDEVWSDDDGLVQKNMRLGKVTADSLFPLDLLQDLAARDEARLLKQGPDMDDADEEDEEEDEDLAEDEGDDEAEEDDGELDEDFSQPFAVLPKMTEKRVAVGETVCVIGIYNELQRGLLPKKGSSTPNRLIRGSAEEVAKKARSAIASQFFGGLIVLVLANAVIFGAMQIYLRSPETIRRRQREAFQAIQEDRPAKLRTLLHRGVNPNSQDSNGRTLLKKAKELGRDELTKILQEAGAKD
ncbi:MAG: hypothetical protein ACKVP0_14775 [Pirellulaceae bacterium]